MNEAQQLLMTALCFQVRVFDLGQVARCCAISPSQAESLTAPLAKRGLISRIRLRVRPLAPPSGPLVRWKPGGPRPHAGRISYHAKERYRSRSVEEITAIVPTGLALDIFGAPKRKPFRRECADHDLGVTEMWLYAYRRWPKVVRRCWQGEDQYVGERLKYEKVEDARLINPRTEEPWMVFEYAGAYRKDRVESFHDYMEEQDLPYWLF